VQVLILYTVTDVNGCSATTTNNTEQIQHQLQRALQHRASCAAAVQLTVTVTGTGGTGTKQVQVHT